MFDFRLINTPEGNQIIDRSLKTPYNSLTAIQMMEYIEVDSRLLFMDRMTKQTHIAAEHRRKSSRNPFYRLACMCGLF